MNEYNARTFTSTEAPNLHRSLTPLPPLLKSGKKKNESTTGAIMAAATTKRESSEKRIVIVFLFVKLCMFGFCKAQTPLEKMDEV